MAHHEDIHSKDDSYSYEYQGKPLSDLESWKLEHSEQDIRGMKLYLNPTTILGTIEEMLVDKEAEEVSAVRLKDGQLVATKDLVIGEDAVYLKQMRIETPFVKVYDV